MPARRLGERARTRSAAQASSRLAVLGLEQGRLFRGRVGLLFHQALHVGVAGAARVPPLRGQQVDDQVAGDPRQPAPERAPRRVGVITLDGPGDGAEDLLDQVLGVGILKPSSPRKLIAPADHRSR